MKSIALLIVQFVPLLIACAADLENFTSAKVTDPLLVIESAHELLPEQDDKLLEARRDDGHVPPVYKKALGKFDVFLVEPFSEKKPGRMDFSAITKHASGRLKIFARSHPYGNCTIILRKGAEVIEEEKLEGTSWDSFTIKFDHEPVSLEIHATGWHYEHGFVTYGFSTQ